MLKIKISVISDALFVLFSSFVLFFTITFYFLKDNLFAILISVFLSIITFCAYMLLYKKKRGKLKIKREDEESFLKCTNALCFSSDEDCKKTVFTALERINKKPVKAENGIICGEDFFFINFSYDSITAGGVTNAYKQTPKGKNLVYLGVSFTPEATDFANGFSGRIRVIPLSEFFVILKETNTLPEGGILPKENKISFFELLKASFSREKAKKFALYGAFLLAMSRFVFFPVWYIISGSIFLIYAITIKFFAPKPIEKTFL